MRSGFNRCLSVAVVLLLSQATFSADDRERLENKIIAYCKKHLGETIGNGECAGLAEQALKAVGAKDRGGPDFPQPRDYCWGRQVLLVEGTPDGSKFSGKIGDVHPGDIIQFRDTKFVKAHYAHHTAIVREIDDKSLKLYQQNAGGQRFVTEGAVRIDKLEQGWLRFYRPLPKKK